jgi:hypothetical protein
LDRIEINLRLQCCDHGTIFAENAGEKGYFDSKYCRFTPIMDYKIGFKIRHIFFLRKFAKIITLAPAAQIF